MCFSQMQLGDVEVTGIKECWGHKGTYHTGPLFDFCFFFKLQDEREARENVKREQDEAYRISLEADRAKVCAGAETHGMGTLWSLGELCAALNTRS